jgi:hypothetical protein
MIIAVASSDARPWGYYLWGRDEESIVEIAEVVLIGIYLVGWLVIGARLHKSTLRLTPVVLARLMVVQLVVLLGEELDWGTAFGLSFRNLRQALHAVLPEVLDTPALAAYLLVFLVWPLIPITSFREWHAHADPVRAERGDGWAAIAGPVCSLLVWPLAGEQGQGELQQLTIYAVLGVITARILRRTDA